MAPGPRQLLLIKTAVFAAALVPAGRLVWRALYGSLGANPVETLTHATGDWTFNFLLLTLSVTPLRTITGLHWLLRLRRMLGLFTFFYATLHFLTFTVFDHGFDLQAMLADVVERPFITVGFTAFVLLIPLAATSFNAAVRWLGGKRWQQLHRSVYAIAILACLHYFWLVKIVAIQWPLLYTAIVVVLLGWRARDRIRRHSAHGTRPPIRKAQVVRFSR